MIAQLIGGRLLESSPRQRRGARPAVASVLVHMGLVGLAVWATGQPRLAAGKAAEHIAAVRLPEIPRTRRPDRPSPTPRKPRGFQVLQAPLDVPMEIPPIDMTRPATVVEDFSGRGVAGGIAEAKLPTFAPRTDPIDGDMADQSPYLLPGQMGPPYPAELRDDRPDGLVVVRFVLDTLGRVEAPSLHVVTATHPLFVASVRAALNQLRYLPASQAGRRVRVRVEQRFEFHVAAP